VLGAVVALFAAWVAYRSSGTDVEHIALARQNLLRRALEENLRATAAAKLAIERSRGSQEDESSVLLRALEVFGDSQRALKWMRESNPALKDDTPLHAIQTDEGRREVLNILGRIEYGVIS
jgi:putative toxin-antitoxin system antitoxin component (TIGR02293 family)